MQIMESVLNGDPSVDEVLEMVRQHMGMEISFVSEFTGGRRVFRHVSHASPTATLIDVGGSDALEDTYCQRIVDGTLDAIICDTREDPTARELAVTDSLGIGAYLGAPIVFGDGSVYGTLCSFSHGANATLTERDLGFMRLMSSLIARRLEADLADNAERHAITALITDALERGQPTMVFQPIFALAGRDMIGVEALARFSALVRRSPDAWFADARRVGLGVVLELAAVTTALEALPQVPSSMYVAINVGPELLGGNGLDRALDAVEPARVVLELTEHEMIDDLPAVKAGLARLRRRGFRLSIDDVGAGYSGLTQILNLAPDIVKLDRAIITGVDTDPARQALVSAAVAMTRSLGGTLIAEGLETTNEVRMVEDLGVDYGQGYELARPGDLSSFLS